MAGRPRKIITNDVVKTDETNISVESNIFDENLKKENDDLKAQLKAVLDKLSVMETDTTDATSAREDDAYKEINPLKPIKVVSITDGGVSLRTSSSGSGKVFRFDKFGHSISITYSDIQDIIATDRSFIEDGMVYICDKDVVRNNYLDNCYNRFLTLETITNILSFDKGDLEDMISNTTEPIQEAIISLLVKKINNNEYVDMNKVDVIGKSCVVPCDISSLALQKRAN